MKAKEMYERETGDLCSTNQIALSEWIIRYNDWLDNKVFTALKSESEKRWEQPRLGKADVDDTVDSSYWAEIRKAEDWFYASEYGKGRIAGFVPMLMVDYAKHCSSQPQSEPRGEMAEELYKIVSLLSFENLPAKSGSYLCFFDAGYGVTVFDKTDSKASYGKIWWINHVKSYLQPVQSSPDLRRDELLERASNLVGHPACGISSSIDIACDNWQKDYFEYLQSRETKK